MKKILSTIGLGIFILTIVFAAWYNPLSWFKGSEPQFGAFGDPFISLQLATSPVANYILSTDGTDNSWIANSGGTPFGGALGDLSDVATTTATVGDVLVLQANGTFDLAAQTGGSGGFSYWNTDASGYLTTTSTNYLLTGNATTTGTHSMAFGSRIGDLASTNYLQIDQISFGGLGTYPLLNFISTGQVASQFGGGINDGLIVVANEAGTAFPHLDFVGRDFGTTSDFGRYGYNTTTRRLFTNKTLDITGDLTASGNATTSGWFNLGATDVVGTVPIGAGDLFVGNNATITGNLTVSGYASSTIALNTQGTLHVGGASSFDGDITLTSGSTRSIYIPQQGLGNGAIMQIYSGKGADKGATTGDDGGNFLLHAGFGGAGGGGGSNGGLGGSVYLYGGQGGDAGGGIDGNGGNVYIYGGDNGSGDTGAFGNLILAHNGTSIQGNVGIGDSTPSSLFTVGDGDKFQIDTLGSLTTTGFGQFNNVTTTDSFFAGGYASSTLGFFTQGIGQFGSFITSESYASSTLGFFSMGNLHIGSNALIEGNATTSGTLAVGKDGGTGTTTLSMTTDGISGSCVEWTNVAGVLYREYVNGAGAKVLESGSCK